MADEGSTTAAPSTLITLRISKALINQLDAWVRERAYKTGQRVTRNGAIVELIQTALQEHRKGEEAG
ncbi:ribbon-helix-helix domain-containing protein [Candidatus Contendibacter odensensis]|uniref:CopG family transcriptional regulator n=1 Tax=Candidatus Contendobacter odensis Run_B_J11 TaxID=1400861 RepID=A0A7U7GC36_9GAMM|nr:ribbon-helix-helix domain-containing protein [Candidatus Contendobacter odensis]CDH45683.1 conserved hypothetical protein [Candidatus Contendobacter odensis Run_B_J11]